MVYFSIESYYLQPGATYEVDWEVYKSGQTIDYGIYSWMATSTIHQQTDSTFLNNSGTHCVTAWLNHVDSNGNLQYLSTDTSCFSVSYNYSDMDNDGIADGEEIKMEIFPDIFIGNNYALPSSAERGI